MEQKSFDMLLEYKIYDEESISGEQGHPPSSLMIYVQSLFRTAANIFIPSAIKTRNLKIFFLPTVKVGGWEESFV